MAINYARLLNRRVTPQSQPIPGSTQEPGKGENGRSDRIRTCDVLLPKQVL